MEHELIRWLKSRYGETSYTTIGIGDDCAVLPVETTSTVVTCDAICDGVHFRFPELSAKQIGRKALAVNLSDLAAMGAKARCVLVSLSLPNDWTLENVKDLYRGMDPLAEKYGVEICGGDTTIWAGPLLLSITAIGTAAEAGVWRMDSAKAGDQILVTGSFGGSIVREHWAFEPRLDFANRWSQHGLIKACTDASDSLGIDLAALAQASELGFEMELDQIPIADDAKVLSKKSKRTPLQHALQDGEDFQLIVAVATKDVSRIIDESSRFTTVTRIGQFTSEQSFKVIDESGTKLFEPSGYEHTPCNEERS